MYAVPICVGAAYVLMPTTGKGWKNLANTPKMKASAGWLVAVSTSSNAAITAGRFIGKGLI